MLQTIPAESFGERLTRMLRNAMRRMAVIPHYFRRPVATGAASEPHILAVTADATIEDQKLVEL